MINFKSNNANPIQQQNNIGPLTNANNALMYIANNEKISAGIIAGTVAAGEKLLERACDIDYFKKSNLPITEGKKGKELVKLLREKELINTLPRTILIPFLSVGAITSFLLYSISKIYSDKKQN